MRPVRLIRGILSLILSLLAMIVLSVAIYRSAPAGYKYVICREQTDGTIVGHYMPYIERPGMMYPEIRYQVGDKTYDYQARGEVGNPPYEENVGITVHYFVDDPGIAYITVELFNALANIGIGAAIMGLLLIFARVMKPPVLPKEVTDPYEHKEMYYFDADDENAGFDYSKPVPGEEYQGTKYDFSNEPAYTPEQLAAHEDEPQKEADPDADTVEGSFAGFGENIYFLDTTGKRVSGWQQIGKKWFYFNPNNNNRCITDTWADVDGARFYFMKDGSVKTGFFIDEKHWFFLNTGIVKEARIGEMLTGWVQTEKNGPFYYFNENDEDMPLGAMFVNMDTPDGRHVDKNGEYLPAAGELPASVHVPGEEPEKQTEAEKRLFNLFSKKES